MPRRDKTGPAGQGPKTGRGLGYCSGGETPGFVQPGLRRGMGYGRGMGCGMGFRGGQVGFYGRRFGSQIVPVQVPVPQITKEQEKEILGQDLNFLEQQIQAIKKRIEEIDKPE